MAKILVHITHGPEHPIRGKLGFLVAKSAIGEGHEVTLFLAGDADQLLREPVLDNPAGLGAGEKCEHYDGIFSGERRFYLNGMSREACGLSEVNLSGRPMEFE